MDGGGLKGKWSESESGSGGLNTEKFNWQNLWIIGYLQEIYSTNSNVNSVQYAIIERYDTGGKKSWNVLM